MLTFAKPTLRAARKPAALYVRASATVAPEQTSDFKLTRRHITVAAIVGSGVFIWARSAEAMNAIEAKKRADERKEKLKQAAADMKKEQKGSSAFADSKYAVSENKDINVHSRQEEGARSQTNV